MIRERRKERPLVSVIVPVYNGEETLRRSVDSVRSQTYDLLDIILVDDGSTDDSGRLCDAYAEEDPRVMVLHKMNGGLMSAWMAGVEIAKGEYLSFVDSDDKISEGMLERMVEASGYGADGHASYRDAEIICCNHEIVREDGSRQRMRHGLIPGDYTGDALREAIFRNILGNQNRTVSMSRCMKLISASLIRGNLRYCDPSVRMGEDVCIMLPAILDSDRIVILKDAYDYEYYYDDDSMAHRYDAGMDENNRKLMTIINRVLTDKFHGERLQAMGVTDDEIRAMAMREKLLLFLLQIKNEIRNPAADVTGRVRRLCLEEMTVQLAAEYPLQMHGFADRLLYNIEKKPTGFHILLAKKLYDLKHR